MNTQSFKEYHISLLPSIQFLFQGKKCPKMENK